MYVSAQKRGFTGFFPLSRANATHYTFILGAGVLAYQLFGSIVTSVTGDNNQQGYMTRNKYKIVSGQIPYNFERSQ
jgi:hypothetical protein